MSFKEIKIKDRLVGPNYDPLVIAEIGINHEGSLKIALEMANAAIDAGAEIIKHQTHIVDDEMSSEAKKIIPGNSSRSIYEIMERCALPEEEELHLKEHIESRECIFISTPFSRAAFARLESFNVPAYKIGSGECNNYPLLKLVAETRKPTIISTGMNNIETIDNVAEIFEKSGTQYAFLHTTNLYPTPPSLVRLGAITELINRYDVPIGLSDHTTSNHACFGAVALGASLLERHFTDHKNRTGPDIICSMDGKDLTDLIEGSKILKEERGGSKEVLDEEMVTVAFAYATVVTIKNIKKGDVLSQDNIWVKRPGTGSILAKDFESVIGKKATRDLKSDTHLSENDFC